MSAVAEISCKEVIGPVLKALETKNNKTGYKYTSISSDVIESRIDALGKMLIANREKSIRLKREKLIYGIQGLVLCDETAKLLRDCVKLKFSQFATVDVNQEREIKISPLSAVPSHDYLLFESSVLDDRLHSIYRFAVTFW